MDLLVCRCDAWNCGNHFANVGESSVRVKPTPRRRPSIIQRVSQKSDETTLKSLRSRDVSAILANTFLYSVSPEKRDFSVTHMPPYCWLSSPYF